MTKMQPDSQDNIILALLRKNSRMPIREIAKKTNIRPSTVHQRIHKLVSNRIIEKFTVKLDNRAVNENFIVFMLVSTDKDLEKSFFEDKRIKEVFGVTGEFDLILKLKFKDIEEFNNYLISLRKNENIRKTVTMVATVGLKEEI